MAALEVVGLQEVVVPDHEGDEGKSLFQRGHEQPLVPRGSV
jgi:hypothetical protein